MKSHVMYLSALKCHSSALTMSDQTKGPETDSILCQITLLTKYSLRNHINSSTKLRYVCNTQYIISHTKTISIFRFIYHPHKLYV